MKKTICSIALLAVCTLPVFAQGITLAANNAPGAVKKTQKGVCHAPGGQHYARVKHFTGYKTMEECVRSGGKAVVKK